jgi:pyridoxine 5-phosphate synthase
LTRLSVNINKIATLRNARGGNLPDLVKSAVHCEQFGADGITVHPRPDQRHIRYDDVYRLKEVVKTEFNVEGYPSADFLKLVEDIRPHQVTLVPDAPDAITSNAGWNTINHKDLLKDIVNRLHGSGIRVSIFIEANEQMIEAAPATGTDRIELYTESYAKNYPSDPAKAISSFVNAAKKANALNLGINAGHDLNLQNLAYFNKLIPRLLEVSIGHALISDALYLGLENTIQMYKRQLSG